MRLEESKSETFWSRPPSVDLVLRYYIALTPRFAKDAENIFWALDNKHLPW